MQRRLPKRGFKNPFRIEVFAVNVGDIDQRCEPGRLDLEALKAAGLVPRRFDKVKILGTGDVTKAFVVQADAFSGSAKEKLEKAGGSAELVAAPVAA